MNSTLNNNEIEIVIENQIYNLIGEIVRLSLKDLFNPWVRRKAKSYNQSIVKVNAIQNRATAEMFFDSKLFELTGLNKEQLIKRYKKEITNGKVYRKRPK